MDNNVIAGSNVRMFTLKELSQRLAALEPEEEIFFYETHNERDDSLESAYGAKRITIFDADTIVINYCGGGTLLALDISVDKYDECHEATLIQWADNYAIGPVVYMFVHEKERDSVKVIIKRRNNPEVMKLYSLTLTLSSLRDVSDPADLIDGEVTYYKRVPETLEEETICMLKENVEDKILHMAKSFNLRSDEYFLDIEIGKSGDYYDSDECEVEINVETNTVTFLCV
jgi:hypothetical protein